MRKTIVALIGVLVISSVAIAQVTTTKAAAKKRPPTMTTEQEKLVNEAMKAGFKPMIETTDRGDIDWTRCRILGKGKAVASANTPEAAASARSKARQAAVTNAVALLGSISPDASGKPAQLTEKIDLEKLAGKLKEISSKFDQESKTATSTVELPLFGPVSAARLLGATFEDNAQPYEWLEEAPTSSARVIVIDARGMGFTPTLAPRLINNDGKQVLGPANLPQDQLGNRPIVCFVYMEQIGVRRQAKSIVGGPLARAKIVSGEAGRLDPQLAHTAEAVWPTALILNADNTVKDLPGALAMTPSAAKEILLHGEAKELLSAGKVIIVFDYTPPTK